MVLILLSGVANPSLTWNQSWPFFSFWLFSYFLTRDEWQGSWVVSRTSHVGRDWEILPDGGKRGGEDAEPLWSFEMTSFELVVLDDAATGRRGRRRNVTGSVILDSQTGEDFDQSLRAQILWRWFRALMWHVPKRPSVCVFLCFELRWTISVTFRRSIRWKRINQYESITRQDKLEHMDIDR